ncbi:MAG: hypothetical protein AVDCRST_MAG30-3266, partial [uncultured Solirubrobacteraceae bacterium]
APPGDRPDRPRPPRGVRGDGRGGGARERSVPASEEGIGRAPHAERDRLLPHDLRQARRRHRPDRGVPEVAGRPVPARGRQQRVRGAQRAAARGGGGPLRGAGDRVRRSQRREHHHDELRPADRGTGEGPAARLGRRHGRPCRRVAGEHLGRPRLDRLQLQPGDRPGRRHAARAGGLQRGPLLRRARRRAARLRRRGRVHAPPHVRALHLLGDSRRHPAVRAPRGAGRPV